MKTIASHEILKNDDGDLALVFDMLSLEAGKEPVVLVSRDEDKAYLRRAPNDFYEISGIHPDILGEARKAEYIGIVEMLGEKVIHSYDAPAGILEDSDE